MRAIKGLALGALMAVSGSVSAQELRCTQIFMNQSEKRICATPALMQLDQEMAQVARRAELHLDSFNSDQKMFRKALKTCKGDEACLTMSYQNRISELQGFVNTLTLPTTDEATKLAADADKAQEKRDAQADTRQQIAAKVEQADASAAQAAAAAKAEVIEEAPQPQVAEQPIAAPVEEVAQAVKPAKGGKTGWGTIAIVAVVILGIILAFFEWLYKAVRRCPKCTKWWAGKIYDQDHESHIEHETKEFVDEHRNRNNQLVGTTRSKRQVAVNVSNTTDYLRCKMCQHEWAISYSSRSS